MNTMYYEKLNKQSLLKKLVSPNSEYQTDLIILPEILIVHWVSSGFSFQKKFPIDNEKNINNYAFWWLSNQNILPDYNKQLICYFTNQCHKITPTGDSYKGFRPTKLMNLIWYCRLDLQSLFPEPNTINSHEFWRWWLDYGANEYNFSNRLPVEVVNQQLTKANIVELFVYFIWIERPYLRKNFPQPLGEDSNSFLLWCFSKLLELNLFSGSVIENISSQFDQAVIDNDDLQVKFPDPFFIDAINFNTWCDAYGVVDNYSLLDIKENIALNESEQLLKDSNVIDDKSKIRVALIGHHTGVLGLGEDARLIAESILLAGFEVDLYDAGGSLNVAKVELSSVYPISEYKGGYQCNIFCLPAFDMLTIVANGEIDVFTNTVNIGIWQWELPSFPACASFAYELVHKIYSISKFSAASIGERVNKNIEVLPLPVKQPTFDIMSRKYFSLPDDSFLFFFALDGNSFIQRKNPLGLIEAFQRAFINDSDVALVIKIMNISDSQIWDECKRRSLYDNRIYIIDESLNRSEFLALLNNTDAVVSLHRSEGFGRIMAEALLLEKPVIASGYSGNLDYLNNENSFLVEGIIIPLFEQDYSFSKGNEWFEPDINHAASHMRYVYSNPKESLEKAKKGKAEIENKYSIQKGSDLFREILKNDLNMIKFFIDSPLVHNRVFNKSFRLSGWAISDSKVKDIKVYINDSLYLTLFPSMKREDVLSAFPKYPKDQLPGFNENIDINELKLGLNEISIQITDQRGFQEDVSIEIERTIDDMDYHYYYIAARNYAHEIAREKKAGDKYLKIIFYVVCESIELLDDTLTSLLQQSYKNIEIKVVSYSAYGQVKKYIENSEYKKIGVRDNIKITSSNPDEYICFIIPGEIMDYVSVEQWVNEIQHVKPGISYTDNDCYLPSGLHCNPIFKPDWSYNYQLSKDYIGGVYFIKSTDAVVRIINSSIDFSLSAWRYDLFFKILNGEVSINHVPDVLWSTPFKDDDELLHDEKVNISLNHINKNGRKAKIIKGADGVSKIKFGLDVFPKVSIIIPTTGRPDLLIPCVTSITSNTAYSNYELLFIDNGRGKYPDGINFLKEKGLTVIEKNEPFNWSRLNNAGVLASDGELLLFLNDDIEATNADWLKELVIHAVRPSIGCVGGLLLYPDGRIQHAGVFLVDHGGGARHWLHFANPNEPVYQDLHKYVREVTANTGACLMMRREVFDEINGFDEDLPIVGNDIDLCLRILQKGYKNIWTPECSLIHHESISRKEVAYTDDEEKMWERWGDFYLSGDPYYNPNLTLSNSNCELAPRKNVTYDDVDDVGNSFGVNLIGYIKAEMGVGEGARGVARALNAAEVPFCIINYERGNPSSMGDNSWDHKIVDKPKYDINVLHINADLTPEVVTNLPKEFFDDKYTIGFWAWELPDFPDEWLNSFLYVDEVWVPSVFVKEAIEKKSSVPVMVLPHTIEKRNLPYLKRQFFELPSDVFLFLMMYDVHSIQERKNPKGAIHAFKNAFSHNDANVGLVIKVNNASKLELDNLQQDIGEYENIYLIVQKMGRYEVDSLVDCCDSFISLHRSEGFGLVLAESMAMGKPVIATNWSGNIDFMNQDNSVCIDYELNQLKRDYGPYKANQYWAEPDIEQASNIMSELVVNRNLAKELGCKAKHFIDEHLSPGSVGLVMKERVDQIKTIRKKLIGKSLHK